METKEIEMDGSLEFEGREFSYKFRHVDSDYGDCIYTDFYEGYETQFTRKYFIFGEKTYFKQPKLVFNLPFQITNVGYTKVMVRDKISHKVALLNRQGEIERGEII